MLRVNNTMCLVKCRVHATSPDTQHLKPQDEINIYQIYDCTHGKQPGKLLLKNFYVF
jgi:hypothetical protein